MPHINTPINKVLFCVTVFVNANKKQSMVLVLGSHIPDNNKAMSQSMVQKKSWVITWYINVNNYCNETKHSKQTKPPHPRL